MLYHLFWLVSRSTNAQHAMIYGLDDKIMGSEFPPVFLEAKTLKLVRFNFEIDS